MTIKLVLLLKSHVERLLTLSLLQMNLSLSVTEQIEQVNLIKDF